MTIISFNKFNPDWQIIIHEPTNRFKDNTWLSDEQKLQYIGPDYYPKLKNKSFITFNVIDFNSIGFNEQCSEVFKSDYIRWHLLSTIGGGWSDMDILYIKPITELRPTKPINTLICCAEYQHIIGFFLSKPNNEFFKKILDVAKDNFNPDDYQSIGANLLNTIYPRKFIFNVKINIDVYNLPMDILYPINHLSIDKIFNSINFDSITNRTIGIHWYNGSSISKEFNNLYNPDNRNIKNTITELINNI